MHVAVLGAGIAGLSAAYTLAEAGHEVTVVDAVGAGAGASGGNGGQLSYSYVQPLADPAIWPALPQLLLSPNSPLKIRPQLDPAQWHWAAQFLRACNSARSRTTTQRLLELAAASRVAFERVRLREQLQCDFAPAGKLVLYRSEVGLRAARAQVDLQRRLGGAQQQVIDAGAAIRLEPALAHAAAGIVGAIHTPSECVADCAKACTELARVLERRGVRLLFGRAVSGLVVRGARVLAARLGSGEQVQADAFVLALGAASAGLVRPLGLRLPLYPLKGYSVTLDLARPEAAPLMSVTDAARKVVFARIGSRLRVAGMAELVGDDRTIAPQRIAALRQATEALFPGACRDEPLRPWTGMRPATPTGEPLVGRHPRGPANLLLNTGHGALGFTLAFGTALRIASALDRPPASGGAAASPASAPARAG